MNVLELDIDLIAGEQLPGVFANLIAQLEMLPAPAAHREREAVHGGERDLSPRGDNLTPGDRYRVRWAKAGATGRREVVRDAHRELIEFKTGPSMVGVFVKGTLEWQRAIATDQRPVRIVARAFGISERQAYRIRAAGRSMFAVVPSEVRL